jgi:MarR family transcriptional regulator, 2-MHQ and catechol-resistance regulon repressor
MKKTAPEPVHVWLVMMKAMQAVTRYAARDIYSESGLGDSDFRVLEVLLHKGSLPVNTIGPKVNLTPGSISVAVDRLYAKGLVDRAESPDDRRVRVVALTTTGKALIVPLFKKHAALMKDVFSNLTAAELQRLETSLKKIGSQAQALAELEAPTKPVEMEHRA